MAKVSVIITVYNKAKYLEKALMSVCEQTLSDIEIILVDDGSTDGSEKICDENALKDHRIKVIHQGNAGQVFAMKQGIKNSISGYIGFVDADDYIEPQMYEELYEAAIECDADIVSSGIIRHTGRVDYDGADEGIYKGDSLRTIFSNDYYDDGSGTPMIYGNTVTKLIKRDLLERNYELIPEDVHYRQDNCFVDGCLVNSSTIRVIHRAYYHYRFIDDSDSNSPDSLFFSRVNSFYSYLRVCFQRSAYAMSLIPQLDRFYAKTIIEGLRFKAGLSMKAYIGGDLLPSYAKKIVIYGAGEYGSRFKRKCECDPDIEVVAVLDKEYEGKRDVYDPSSVKRFSFDILAIAIVNRKICCEVKKQMMHLGVYEEQIYFV